MDIDLEKILKNPKFLYAHYVAVVGFEGKFQACHLSLRPEKNLVKVCKKLKPVSLFYALNDGIATQIVEDLNKELKEKGIYLEIYDPILKTEDYFHE